MVLLKTLFYSVHFKLLFLILCPNTLKRYVKVSPFSGGKLQVFLGGRVAASKKGGDSIFLWSIRSQNYGVQLS